ncbi:MAG: PSD1 and planctomycete cytochrome C domain-containing protein [Verrucomicrobiota bacterium]|nr:PSD1 and planctomycete cytochrome C domain-containing protein [Verrucomicrobiota bacterium]
MMISRLIILLIAISLGLSKAEEIQFNKSIKPILSNNCFSCHGPDAKVVKGGLQLHLREKAISKLEKSGERAITPGNRDESSLWHRITSTDPDEQMPPPESNHKLSSEEIKTIGQWIDEGAEYQGHWSLQPINPETGTIDDFIKSKLKEVGLSPSTNADPQTLIRRLNLDLTGLPPTQSEINKFINDKNINAYEKIVDRLLSSTAFAERLAVNWLDAARYADTNGYSIDDHRDMWVWRDWVISSFLENKPFDQFTLEQIAGDMIPNNSNQQKVATGFLRNGMNTHEGGTIAEEYRVTYTADKVDTVSTVFMGMTMKCAQCHDHKYDPISQEEYYKFFAFFNTSSEPGNGAINANTKPLIEAESPICSIDRVKRDASMRISELRKKRINPEINLAKQRDDWENKKLESLKKQLPDSENKDGQVKIDDSVKWIWSDKDNKSAKAEFQKSFILKNDPLKAFIWFTCDNECTIKINDQIVGTNDDWTKPKQITVKNLLKGQNTIQVQATNQAGSEAGFILSMQIILSSGEKINLVSDSSWKSRANKLENESWTKATAIANYGEAPWGNIYQKNTSEGFDQNLYLALNKNKSARSNEDWNKINDSFSSASGAFKIYINQLNLEEKAIQKTAKTGKSTVMVMNYKPRKTHILIRGAYNQHGDEVNSGTPSAILPGEASSNNEATRLDLAKWLINPDHPLTSRVIVNRYWQMIFGTGLVKTSEDFGSQGEYPSHPELLDRLAKDFVNSGWNLRKMIKRIVMSDTYKQKSNLTKSANVKDPYNRLLSRSPRFRIDAEFVRDSALFASGLLSRDIGGPSVYPYQPNDLWADVSHYGYPSGFTSQKYLPGSGSSNHRRSMYTVWKRTSPPPSMIIFDAPNRETCTVRRLQTNTPMQALVLQNDPQYLEAAVSLGKIMSLKPTPKEGIEEGFIKTLGRKPKEKELTILMSSLTHYISTYETRQKDAVSLLRAGQYFGRNSIDTKNIAAWTLVASTLFNMDEFVTRQ